MYRTFCASVLALTLPFGAAQAATVGGFTFDENDFADNATIALTVPGTLGPAAGPAAAADGNLATATNLNDSFVELFFIDNVLINGPGDDIVIFGGTNNNVIRLSASADTNAAWTTGSTNFIPAGAPGNTSGFSLNGATIDLSSLGFADGAEITDGLFIARGGVFSTVWDVAALNSRDASPANPVPLPAGLPMLLCALGAFGLLRRTRG